MSFDLQFSFFRWLGLGWQGDKRSDENLGWNRAVASRLHCEGPVVEGGGGEVWWRERGRGRLVTVAGCEFVWVCVEVGWEVSSWRCLEGILFRD